jgi:hypothetical protein
LAVRRRDISLKTPDKLHYVPRSILEIHVMAKSPNPRGAVGLYCLQHRNSGRGREIFWVVGYRSMMNTNTSE